MQTNPESISLRGVGSETCKRQKRVKAETAPGTDDESDQVLENRIAFHTSEAARLQSILDLRVEHNSSESMLPSSVFVAASGKRNAADAIKQPRAQSMKRPRQMDPSSGDLHPAAESGANLAVEEAHSEKPAGLNTESSGVPQPAASCHEPRSPMVFMKILEPIWAAEVADGQKMFECVANKTKWQNQFKQLSSGDLFIVVMKGRDKVNAVCEVASPAIVKETNRDVLKSKVQESRHAALDAYLDGAESFDYVEYKLVFDCRHFLLSGSTLAFLNYVGLSAPKSPSVGLLRPVVRDEHWHNRLYEYMHNRSICHRQ